jgi:hypothetical protein
VPLPVPRNTAPVKVPFTSKPPTKLPSPAPVTTSPITTPVNPPTRCGFLGWNLFCPRQGQCGFFRRLFNIGGCE